MRYKVLIIEDEPGIRKRLVKLMDWEAMNCEICGEADSGITGLEVIINQRPDIVISDIVMPGIDGLMLLQYVKEHYPGTRFLIMSAYQEFSYVKQAMELGAFNFLTKPINPDELKKAVSELVLRLNEEAYQNLSHRQAPNPGEAAGDLLKLALQGEELDEYSSSQISRLLPKRYAVVCFQLNGTDVLARERCFSVFSQSVEKRLRDADIGLACTLGGSCVAAVLPEGGGESLSAKGLANKFCAGLSGFQFPYGVGISEEGEGLPQLRDKFQESQEALSQRFYRPEALVHQYRSPGGQELNFAALSVMLQAIPDHLEDFTQELFAQLGKTESPQEAQALAMASLCLLAYQSLGSGQKYLKYVAKGRKKLKEFWKLESLEQTKSVFQELCARLYVGRPSRGGDNQGAVVRSVMEYIGAHYSEEITVGSAADQVYLSPSYLSALLKSYTGQTFTDLLVAYRMDRAKEFLAVGEKIGDVSQKVGYKDAQYFSTVFKNAVGITPSEYRNLKGEQST